MKGVIYARYSSDNQTEQSIEGQLRVCQEYAKNNNTNGKVEWNAVKMSVAIIANTKANGTKWKSEMHFLFIFKVLPIQKPFAYFCFAEELTVGLENWYDKILGL